MPIQIEIVNLQRELDELARISEADPVAGEAAITSWPF